MEVTSQEERAGGRRKRPRCPMIPSVEFESRSLKVWFIVYAAAKQASRSLDWLNVPNHYGIRVKGIDSVGIPRCSSELGGVPLRSPLLDL
jgi:hypothetical protein